MVAPAVPRFGFVPQVNLSRLFLFRAADALDAGRIFEAGVLLREAVRRQLYAECAWSACLPKKESLHRSPTALAYALHEAGHCDKDGLDWTMDAVEAGNKCAHCVPVKPSIIRCTIEWWHTVIDCYPCGEPKDRTAQMKPQTDGDGVDDDDDDDDDADWWKAGVA